jgi:hypothetical protein
MRKPLLKPWLPSGFCHRCEQPTAAGRYWCVNCHHCTRCGGTLTSPHGPHPAPALSELLCLSCHNYDIAIKFDCTLIVGPPETVVHVGRDRREAAGGGAAA